MKKEIIRCSWCMGDPLYIDYHDKEWGKFVKDDLKIFEYIVLESSQAGLSWFTILKRRDGYKKAFANFNPKKISLFTDDDIEKLINNPEIIRNKLKIKATVSNAKSFLKIVDEFGSFYNYLINFFPNKKPIVNNWKSVSEIPATSDLSDMISKDMKKRGFKFFGSTICYAHLQATGYINDHLADCHFKNS